MVRKKKPVPDDDLPVLRPAKWMPRLGGWVFEIDRDPATLSVRTDQPDKTSRAPRGKSTKKPPTETRPTKED